ncbi:MAG: Cation transporter [Gemmatimonadetes bacterium]|jgi:Ca2+:H+ antiporter|nr:Cation transporter [Gemmatimonadota bacterium]
MRILLVLLLFVPAAIAAELMHASPVLIFALAALAIIPLSGFLGRATEEIAVHTGPTLGGLLNATLGNMAELIIAVLALRAGLVDLVKASITGSILGNLLLVLGLAQLMGGLKHKVQKFNIHLAGLSISLLVISVIGLVIPALFLATHDDPQHHLTLKVSVGVAVLLVVGYGLSLLYSMGTHKAVFGEVGGVGSAEHDAEHPAWNLRKSLAVLLVSAAFVGWLSEILVGSTEAAIRDIGLSEIFVGLIIVPIIGNAAEHSSAVLMAMKNRMDLAVGIAIGSSAQVALLIAPLLVFVGLALGRPMDLAFSQFEVVSVALAVAVAASVVRDAESNWLEGAFLLLVYGMLAVAFFYF